MMFNKQELENIKESLQKKNEIIENQGITIITTGRALKDEMKKTKLLLDAVKSIAKCPECLKKVEDCLKTIGTDEIENSCDNCIYRNDCIRGGETNVCNEHLRSVV